MCFQKYYVITIISIKRGHGPRIHRTVSSMKILTYCVVCITQIKRCREKRNVGHKQSLFTCISLLNPAIFCMSASLVTCILAIEPICDKFMIYALCPATIQSSLCPV